MAVPHSVPISKRALSGSTKSRSTEPGSTKAGPNAHILVVDDDASIRVLLTTFFEKVGYQVSVASSGTEALRYFHQEPTTKSTITQSAPSTVSSTSTSTKSSSTNPQPEAAPLEDADFPIDLVLLDMKMPDMSGLQVCTELRQDSDVPVIVLSGTAEDSELLTTAGLTIEDFIQKPFSVRDVEARVKSALHQESH